ncbi:MAG: alpha/beta fold hydrolase [Gemmatimonadota bacterium]
MNLPKDLQEVEIASTLDGAREKCLVYCPPDPGPVPLLVGLHSWSFDRHNQIEAMLPRCRKRRWALVLPEFRGPNRADNPRARQACASLVARQDIVDAVDFALKARPVDPQRVFLLGGSGGGHMAMMMAAYAPQRFAGISAWVGITDLIAWHGENLNYAPHVEACCGGAPGASPEVDEEYRQRSPLSHVAEMATATLYVHHGRYDQSVRYNHSWQLAQQLEQHGAGRFYCEIFDGGHEIRYDVALAWFEALASSAPAAAPPVTG